MWGVEEKQGYLRVLWESQEDRFAPYFQFSEQCVLPGVQEGYPFLFPYLKIVRIVAGTCVWALPRKRHVLAAGDYILFNNIEPRALTEVTGDEPLLMEQAIILPTSFPTALLRTDVFYLCREGIYGDSPVLRPDRAGYALLDASYLALSAEIRSPARTDPMVYARYLAVAESVSRCFPTNDADFVPDGLRISEVTQYISAHIADPALDPAAVALHFGISKARFLSTFSRCAGMSATKYIRLVRVQNVIFLLRSHRMNVIDAAMESGFRTSSGFYKAFGEITGKSPREAIHDTASIV